MCVYLFPINNHHLLLMCIYVYIYIYIYIYVCVCMCVLFIYVQGNYGDMFLWDRVLGTMNKFKQFQVSHREKQPVK